VTARSIRTDRTRETFLKVLAETCNVSEAARAAGVGRRTMYDWRDADPSFADAWKDAEETSADKLEQVAFERATSGQSDRMLEILLKAHRPKYREKQAVEFSGSVQVDHANQAQAEIDEIFGPPRLVVNNA
jgi:transposase